MNRGIGGRLVSTPLRAMDIRLINELFEMGSGYVLDFSDLTFVAFFEAELGVDIDHPHYRVEGTSKAKRVRFFLKVSDPQTRVRVLRALWEYREALRRRRQQEDKIPNAEKQFNELLARVAGHASQATTQPVSPPRMARAPIAALRSALLQISDLEAHQRGYAYERFLKNLFDANGLAGRASFRLIGEQIDGSFELAGETYLLEAKWQASQVGAADLRSFNAKVEDKAAWSRGLFVSNSGFSEDGLAAFGRGKRVVCMDGLDLYDMLEKGLAFSDVMARKVRHAAESGQPFVRVRNLFP
jgi:Restriction endonuclease